MDNIIKAIELLGKTATLESLSVDDVHRILNPLDLDAEVQQAIINKDTAALEMMLDVRHKIVCMINKPQPDDEPQDTPEEQDDEPEQTPERAKAVS